MKGTLSTEAAKTEETLQKMQARVCEAEQAADEAHRKMNNALMAQQAAETRYINIHMYAPHKHKVQFGNSVDANRLTKCLPH